MGVVPGSERMPQADVIDVDDAAMPADSRPDEIVRDPSLVTYAGRSALDSLSRFRHMARELPRTSIEETRTTLRNNRGGHVSVSGSGGQCHYPTLGSGT
ncbi:MAG TPA: hypothetical protein VGS08_00560 [Candidatus Saccharimonadales bacterium]|nr:hypothetical protein [Candidatus Saccharimonadales bacterium]